MKKILLSIAVMCLMLTAVYARGGSTGTLTWNLSNGTLTNATIDGVYASRNNR